MHEVMAPSATDLSWWRLALYNGSDGKQRTTSFLFGVFSDGINGWGTLQFDFPTLLKSNLDAVALMDYAGGAVQFFPLVRRSSL